MGIKDLSFADSKGCGSLAFGGGTIIEDMLDFRGVVFETVGFGKGVLLFGGGFIEGIFEDEF